MINSFNRHEPTNTMEKVIKEYCEECCTFQETNVVNIKETYTVRGDEITIIASVRVCGECGTPVFDEELDSKNIKKAFEKYSSINNLLSPDQIVELRNKFGLSQRGLATLLNWSPATVARYEQGSIPSSSHHEILVNFIEDLEFVKRLFEKEKSKLGKLDIKRMTRKLSEFEEEELELDTILLLNKKFKHIKDPIYHGYTTFDFNKLTSIISYLSSKISRISKTKLMKLLFYTDFKYFKEYGLSISGLSYKHLPYGPVPDHYWLMLEALTENKIVELKPFDDFEGEYIEVLEKPDLSFFDDDEIEILDCVVDYFKTFNAVQISDYSHQEDAYLKTKDREYISYEFADSLRAFN